jgi:hypothetical protein
MKVREVLTTRLATKAESKKGVVKFNLKDFIKEARKLSRPFRVTDGNK